MLGGLELGLGLDMDLFVIQDVFLLRSGRSVGLCVCVCV